jgi:hypothetical protein
MPTCSALAPDNRASLFTLTRLAAGFGRESRPIRLREIHPIKPIWFPRFPMVSETQRLEIVSNMKLSYYERKFKPYRVRCKVVETAKNAYIFLIYITIRIFSMENPYFSAPRYDFD